MGLETHIDPLLRQAVDQGAVPGVVAMATDRDDIIYAGAFGERIKGSGTAMTADTVVWIASMTKAITGLAAMQLVERGLLDLNGPASRVLPELGKVQVLQGFDTAGEPVLRAPTRQITLRHLLTHTAGFGYEIWNDEIGRYQEKTGIPGITTCENAALKTPLLFEPGERWNYGINIDFAGKMVEAVSGQTLGQYLKQNVFDPLGMADTAFRIRPDMRERLAKIHERKDDGSLAPVDIEIPQEPEFEMGGGGLYGTVGDYLKFVRMMLNQGRVGARQILKPETVAAMSRNQMGDCRVTLLKTEKPGLSNDAEFFPGMEKTWGLSFMINTQPAPTGRSAGSLAWAGLANTYYWIDQAKGVGGVYATQILPFADVKSLPLFLDFETAVYRNL
ncbi:serine hydrolase domain-containing protein [Desertibaculum subflavum]|uniref:serine hydrolase domain-containing protein n=1 Tax=Desertibaculum subflavum TaxID=2268458 RepID=UPI000E66856A